MTKYDLSSDPASDASALENSPPNPNPAPKRNYRRTKKTPEDTENLAVSPDAAAGQKSEAKPDAAASQKSEAKPDAAAGQKSAAKPDAAASQKSEAKPDAAASQTMQAANPSAETLNEASILTKTALPKTPNPKIGRPAKPRPTGKAVKASTAAANQTANAEPTEQAPSLAETAPVPKASKPKATSTPRRRAPKKTDAVADALTPQPQEATKPAIIPTKSGTKSDPTQAPESSSAQAPEKSPAQAPPQVQALLLTEISQAAPSFSPSIAQNILPTAQHSLLPAHPNSPVPAVIPHAPENADLNNFAPPKIEVQPEAAETQAMVASSEPDQALTHADSTAFATAEASDDPEFLANAENSDTPRPAKRRRSRRSNRHRPEVPLTLELASRKPAPEDLILILDPNKHPNALETIIEANPKPLNSAVMASETAFQARTSSLVQTPRPEIDLEAKIDFQTRSQLDSDLDTQTEETGFELEDLLTDEETDFEDLLTDEETDFEDLITEEETDFEDLITATEAAAADVEASTDPDAESLEIPLRKSRSARRRKASQKAKLLAQAELKQTELKQTEDPAVAIATLPVVEEEEAIDSELTEANKRSKKTPASLRKMLISVLEGDQVEVVLTEDGKLVEYYVEMQHHAKIRGNIYKGTISNIDVNLQAAFVNYGKAKNGFLQIDEVHPEYYLQVHEPAKGRKYPPIQKVLKPGQEVLVQVVKEPNGNKGAFLTTWASLAGRFLVLTPGQEQIGISRKVEEGEERNRLREMIKGLDPGPGLGVIVRTVSAGTSKTTLQKDLNFLKRLWKDIRKRATTEKAPSLIYQEPDLAPRAIRDYLSDDITEVWVDNEKTSDSIREMASLLFPRKHDLVHLFTDSRKTMWERFSLLGQLEEVHAREVIMPSGARLVFDQTEALMAVDINSGKISGKGNFESMAHRTNMEAANIIAHQLRLRDIGGQIVIDFIEMRDPEHCRLVEKELRNAMKIDRARHDISKISAFGLMEIVRQRTGTSAISITLESCPHCKGTGQRRNLEWRAVQALRDIHKSMRAAKAADQTNCIYPLETELAMYILNHKKERLCFLEKDFNLTLIIKTE